MKEENQTWNSNCEGSVALIECLVHFRKMYISGGRSVCLCCRPNVDCSL